MIPILILAAGASSRMGARDKLLEPVGGQPLLRRLAKHALTASDTVFVALYHKAEARLAALDGLAVTPMLVPDAAEGMSGTLRGGVARLPECPAFLVLLSDLPEITSDDIMQVIATRAAHPDHLIWRGATTDGRPGHPILFDSSLRPQFDMLTGDGGGETLVNPLRDKTFLVRFDTDRARLDLDTPADWENWRANANGGR